MSDEQQEKLTFQQKVILPVSALFADLFKEVPELRSACVMLDWKDDINDALPPCLWLDEHNLLAQGKGPGDAIVSGLRQTVRTLQLQTEVGLRLIQAYDMAIKDKEQLAAQVEERLSEQSKRLDQLAEGQTDLRQEPGHDPDNPRDR